MPAKAKAYADSMKGGPIDDDEAAPWEMPPTDSTGGTVAIPDVVQGEIGGPAPATAMFMQWLAQRCEHDTGDTGEVTEQIISEILAAPSLADALAEKVPVSGKNYVDQPMMLQGFRIVQSDIEGDGAFPFYAAMRVMVGNPPEPRIVNCGGTSVLAALYRMDLEGEWPQFITLVDVSKKAGRTVLKLRLAE